MKNEPHGGGFIWIHSYQLSLIDASLFANGNSDRFQNDGGGGAGGSILIAVNNITGNSIISANGADAVGNGGAGSGGRIKFYYF